MTISQNRKKKEKQLEIHINRIVGRIRRSFIRRKTELQSEINFVIGILTLWHRPLHSSTRIYT